MITSIEPGVPTRPLGVRIETWRSRCGWTRLRLARSATCCLRSATLCDRYPLHRQSIAAPDECEWLDRYLRAVRDRLLPLVTGDARLAAASYRAAGVTDCGRRRTLRHRCRRRQSSAIRSTLPDTKRWRERVASRRLRRVVAGAAWCRAAAGGGRRRAVHDRRRHPGTVTRRGVMKNCSHALNNRPLPRTRGAAGPGGARRQRRQLPRVVRGHRWRGAGAEGIRGDLGHRRQARHCSARSCAEGPNDCRQWGITVPWAEPGELRVSCYCGQQGCVETRSVARSLARPRALARRQQSAERSPRVAPRARRLRSQLAALGVAPARRSRTCQPARSAIIVLGGGLSRIERLYASVPPLLPRWVFAGECDEPVRTRIACTAIRRGARRSLALAGR